MSNYKVKAWSWCADYCKKNQWNPHDSYFWDKAMLEYRRANNIFEVGDKVVCKHENIDLCDSIVLEIESFRDDLITLGDFVRFTNGNDFKLEGLRHATDEEIAAGHRI